MYFCLLRTIIFRAEASQATTPVSWSVSQSVTFQTPMERSYIKGWHMFSESFDLQLSDFDFQSFSFLFKIVLRILKTFNFFSKLYLALEIFFSSSKF